MQAIVEALIGTRKVENVNADFWEDTTQHCIPYIFRSGCQVFRTIKSSALREQKRKMPTKDSSFDTRLFWN
jgi:hypothetical protein